MTEKIIKLALTQEQFILIWNALNCDDFTIVDDCDVETINQLLDEMEIMMEDFEDVVFEDDDDGKEENVN